MLNEVTQIATLALQSFFRIWPYLLVTIPLAVAVRMSGAAEYIRRAFARRPVPAIILATLVGAFSPFCSCGVIPVVASLLIGGVPLGPVMSFWIASPSMDPEIFFLSVATLGWELALWRLLSTLVLSLSAGFVTHLVTERGWISGPVLRVPARGPSISFATRVRELVRSTRKVFERAFAVAPEAELCCAATAPVTQVGTTRAAELTLTSSSGGLPGTCNEGDACPTAGPSVEEGAGSFVRRLLRESRSASFMVAKFMLLAITLEAVITRYVPQEAITALLGSNSHFAIVTAALIGVPLYTSNLSALPLVGALLDQGMNPSASLAFLIVGPTTTIPAMAAVWGLVRRRVFALYVGFALIGAVVLGALHLLVSAD